MRPDNFKLSVILPAHNEEKNVLLIAEKLHSILQSYPNYELIFVDDGSHDATLEQLKELHQQDHRVQYISFSNNFGHMNALRAGLDHASGDAVVCLDADMQHPPELIPELISKWQEGYDIVYTVRKETQDERFFKKLTSRLFYSLINKLSNLDIKPGAADFRLMDKNVVQALRQFKETCVFYRGLIANIGFKQTFIPYIPQQRLHGETKYNLKKMVAFALDGITAFSVVPLRFASLAGVFVSFFSFAYAVYAILVRILGIHTVPGWSSLLCGIFFLGGIQLIMIGILGEYIGKLFLEVKRRPNYIIKQTSLSSL